MLTAIFLTAAMTANPTPESGTRPVSIGAPHDCAEVQYPVSALQTATEGNTVMKFSITADGHVRDVAVYKSSGNTDLDAAAMTCAAGWLYRPAIKDGVAIDVPWLAQVKWQIGVVEPFSTIVGAARSCLRSDSVGWDELEKAPLRPVARVRFSGGTISDVVTAGTSGDPDLDARVLACYRNLPPELPTSVPDGERLQVIMKPGE